MDHKSTFIKRFGDLVALLRFDPGNDAAQDLALTAATSAAANGPLEIEAAVEWAVVPAEFTLKSRLLARQVEYLRIEAGAEPHELLALARALSHDRTPLPNTARVRIRMAPRLLVAAPAGAAACVEEQLPVTTGAPDSRRGERRRWEERRGSARPRWIGGDRRRASDRRTSGERRLLLLADQRAVITQLHNSLSQAARGSAWETSLQAASALVRIAPRVPSAERRGFEVRLREALPRRSIEALINLADRDPTTREAVTAVLRWIGVGAAEAILERLRQGEAIGVRGYYYEVLGGMPEVYPLVPPMLHGRAAHEIRHGAALLGRLGRPEGVDELEPLLTHRDERIRTAAVRALGEIHQGSSADPLRQAMHSSDARTRAAAADAIAVWRSGALALLLVSALETERDRDVWHAEVSALGRIGTMDACAALVTVALTPRKLFRRQGYTTWQRLAAVTALGLSDTPLANAALERLSREGEGAVRRAADRILQTMSQPTD